MAIDFTLPPDVVAVRERVRAFMESEVAAAEARMRQEGSWRKGYAALREKARAAGLWAPHMPAEWGGLGLGALAVAFVAAEGGRTRRNLRDRDREDGSRRPATAGAQHGLSRRHGRAGLDDRAGRGDHGRARQSLRDPPRGRARGGRRHPGRPGPGPPPRAGAPR